MNQTNFFCSSPKRFRPDPARAFVANHASPHGILWCAGFHEQGALAGLDFPDDNEMALATQQNILPLLNFDAVLQSRIVAREFFA